MHRLAAIVFLSMLGLACVPPLKSGCETSDDCTGGRLCVSGTCQEQRRDGGSDGLAIPADTSSGCPGRGCASDAPIDAASDGRSLATNFAASDGSSIATNFVASDGPSVQTDLAVDGMVPSADAPAADIARGSDSADTSTPGQPDRAGTSQGPDGPDRADISDSPNLLESRDSADGVVPPDAPNRSDRSEGSPDREDTSDSPSLFDRGDSTDGVFPPDAANRADGSEGPEHDGIPDGPDPIDTPGLDGSEPTDGANGEGGPPPLSLGLVSWWRGDGTPLDSQGPNHATLQGGVAYVEGKLGQAFQFNGTDATVTVESSDSLMVDQAFTLAFWIRIHSWPSELTVVLRKLVIGSEDKHIVLSPNGEIAFFLFDLMTTDLCTKTLLSLDTWHHVAGSYDGTQVRLYIDGSLDASVAASGSISNGMGPLVFGQSLDFPYFAGALDEIRWYSRALTDAEVESLAAGGI